MSAALRSSASLADCADISDRLPNDATRPLLVSGGSGKGGEGSAKGHRTWGRREEGTFYPAAAFSLKRRCFLARWVVCERPERSKTNEKEACDAPVLEGDAHDGKPRLASKTERGSGCPRRVARGYSFTARSKKALNFDCGGSGWGDERPTAKATLADEIDSRMTVRNAPIGILT